MTDANVAGSDKGDEAELQELGKELLSAAPARAPRDWSRRVARFRHLTALLATPEQQAAAHLRLAECLQTRANARDGIRASLEAEREARAAARLTEGLGVRLRLHALNDLANILHDRADRRFDAPAAREAEATFSTAMAEATQAGDTGALADLRNNLAGIYSAKYRRGHLADDLLRALSLYREARAGFVQLSRHGRLGKAAGADGSSGGLPVQAAPPEVSYRQRWANTADNALSLEADHARSSWDRGGLLRAARRMRRVVRVAEAEADSARVSKATRDAARLTAAKVRHTLAIALSHAGELEHHPDLLAEAAALWARNRAVWTRDASARDWARLLNSEASNLANLASVERAPGRFREALEAYAKLADLPSLPIAKGVDRKPWTFRSAPENYAQVVHNVAILRQELAHLELDQTHLEDARMDLERLLGWLARKPGHQRDATVERLAIIEVASGAMLHDRRACEVGLERYRSFAEHVRATQGSELAAAAAVSLAQLLRNAWIGLGDPSLLAEAVAILRELGETVKALNNAQVDALFRDAGIQVEASEALRDGDAEHLANMAARLRAGRLGLPPTATSKQVGELAILELDVLMGSVRAAAQPARWEAALPHLEELRTLFAADATRMLDASVCIGETHLKLGHVSTALEEWEAVQEGMWTRMLQAEGHGARQNLLEKVSRLDPRAGPTSPSLGDALGMALLGLSDGSGPLRALRAVARGRSLLRAAHRPYELPGDAAALRDRLRSSEASALASGLPPPHDAAGLAAHRRARADADAARAAFFGALSAAGLSEPPEADVARICAALGNGSALVVVLAVEAHSAAVIVRKAAEPPLSTVRFPDLGLVRLHGMAADLDACMTALAGMPTGEILGDAETRVDALCRSLGEAVGDALVAHLERTGTLPGTELLLMLPGLLAALPVHAAWLRGDRERPLLASFPIRYVQFLPDVSELAPAFRKPGSTLVVADPGDEWPARRLRLPGFADGAGGGHRLEGPTANRAAVVNALGDAGTFVFEGHAHFDRLRPERSYLALAGSDRLTLSDLGAVASARRGLCVLTACEGARLDVRRLSDEFVGLATALLDCGFDDVVASTWPVDLDAAHVLVGAFWEAFRRPGVPGRSASRALSEAQLGCLRAPHSRTSGLTMLRMGDTPLQSAGDTLPRGSCAIWWAGFRVLSAK